MSVRGFRTLLALAVLLGPATVALAQDDAQGGAKMWNINVMVDKAAEGIIKRYKLNDQQADFTRKMMSRRVDNLLRKHEDKVRKLFGEAFAMRAMGKPPSKEAIQSWAERAMPVYKDARKEILAGNEEWAKVLTPEQKKIHKLDLKMMEVDFKNYEDRLQRWAQGGFDPDKDWIQHRNRGRQKIARNRKQKQEQVAKDDTQNRFKKRLAEANEQKVLTTPPPPNSRGPMTIGQKKAQTPDQTASGRTVRQDPLDYWDGYVNDFCRKYRLDSGQVRQAKAILKDLRTQANQHRESHKEEYEQIRAELRRLRGSPDAGEATARANARLAELDAAINVLFEELKGRLNNIPTSAQMSRVESSQ